nr:PREDICTED: uncharacterized protein LOC108217000 [Daucus carota subsp. sativus]
MISVYELCSGKSRYGGHTLKLKEDDIVGEDANCIGCEKSIKGSPTYICSVSHDDLDCRGFYLHKSCAELSIRDDYHGHPLRLIEEEDDIKGGDSACFVCNKQIVAGFPTYTCIHDVDVDCQNFYLHKTCTEFPLQLNHHKHNKHSLAFLPAPDCVCDVCFHALKFAYACDDCKFHVCVFCAFEQRVLSHQGHPEHALTLIKRESLFTCDACYEEAKESSYLCLTCDFWIHKTCALSPSTIQASNHHHHPLTLVYSIPDIHRYFVRSCNICNKVVHPNFWVYYCQKCTYFAHIKCATSSVIIKLFISRNEIEAEDIDNELALVQFPLPSKESLFDLIITQYYQGESFITWSRRLYNPLTLIFEHWSHPDHPLQKLRFSVSEDDDDDSDDDAALLICDGCIQPITLSHPTYYACIQCGYFLHSFCATELPPELPAGASTFHPQHPLMLWKRSISAFGLVTCGACASETNGFFYHCKTCDIRVDIRCAFLPTRIKHISHKHSLVQRPFSEPMCSISKITITGGLVYGCETCSDVHISILCVFLPSIVKHRFDSHPITLRLPPFFYEGVFYCELCEEQVNNQWPLYHCDESDHSFHYNCFDLLPNIKFGGTIELDIDHKSHTFTFVLERPKKKGFLYKCRNCADSYEFGVFFRCDGCGYLACYGCVNKVLGGTSPNEFVIPE